MRDVGARPRETNAGTDGDLAVPSEYVSCRFCSRRFGTTRGASLHERMAHGEDYHADRAAVIRNRVLCKARWEPEEDRLLARAVILAARKEFPTVKAENEWIVAQGEVPGRSLQAVKERRRRPAFVKVLDGMKSKSGDDHSPLQREPARPNTHDDTRLHDETTQHPPTLIHDRHTAQTQQHTEADRARLWTESLQRALTDPGWQVAAISALSLRVLEGCGPEEARSGLDAIVTAMTRPSARQLAGSKGTHGNTGDTRRAQYAELQRAWRKSVSGAARRVLDGSWRGGRKPTCNLETQEAFWAPLFSDSSLSDERPVSDAHTTQDDMMLPITEREVHDVQMALDRESACGPDMVSARMIRAAPPLTLARLFNLFLYLEYIPTKLTHSRTVLIPKIDKPTDPSHYRPITISSFIIRLFTKILANRSSRLLKLDPIQRAFIPTDGCSENIHILNSILHDSRVGCRRLCVATIDLRKAFDSVSHGSILRAYRRAGAPEGVVNIVRCLYERATTEIRRDTIIRVRRGVRQGDPLSPFLFNAVIDEALVLVNTTADGGDLPPVLAFADDVVLLARTPAMMQRRINLLISALEPTGLNINAAKCASLTVISDPKRKIWVVDPTVEFAVGAEKVRALNSMDHIRYLGVDVGCRGTGFMTSPPTALQCGLAQIRDAPLKPEQRLRILREYLLPKLQHTLISQQPRKKVLSNMDLTIRRSVRSWLHLPHDTAKPFFHASSADGGLGIPSLVTQVPAWRARRLAALRRSDHPSINRLLQSEYYRTMISRCRALGLPNVESKSQLKLHWRQQLYSTVDGNGLEQYRQAPNLLDWIRGTGLLRGAAYVTAVRTLGNLLPTAERCHRGGRDGRTTCEAGCRRTETLAHICQVCPRTSACRINRHDKVVNFVAGRLRERGHLVEVEPALPTERGVLRPDIVAFNPGTKQVSVIDAQVVADNAVLDDAHRRKAQHYAADDLAALLKKRFDPPPLSVQPTSATFNWRGAVSARSARDLQSLGLTRKDLRRMSTDVILGSAACFSMFTKSTAMAWTSQRTDYTDWTNRRRHPRTGQG